MVQLNGHLTNKTNNETKNDVSIIRKNVQLCHLFPTISTSSENNLKQFASAYTARLAEMSKELVKKATKKWNKKIVSLADIEDFKDDSCIIVGTLYKHQQWKPSILREICEEDQLLVSEPKTHYCSESDQLFLEDDTARIRLVGDNLNINEFVTGVVAAILGYENESSKFEVQDWCYIGCPLQTQIRSETRGKLVLLSGLNMMENYNKLSVTLLKEWLTGLSGDTMDQEDDASIVQVIIAGNGVPVIKQKADEPISYNTSSANNAQLLDSLGKLDDFISEIAENCQVAFMPGENDAVSVMMPQKPLHPCLLPKSRRYKSFTRTTNPWVCKIGTRVITGSSGQPIQDIAKVCGGGSCLNWLEETLNWGHLCPTSPDTIPSYPCFDNGDVMIMRECPDVYFTGNMDKFETKLWKGEENQTVRLICVPNFSSSQTAVIVDLENLDVQTISFGAK